MTNPKIETFKKAMNAHYLGQYCSMKAAIVEMYLAGVSIAAIEDISTLLGKDIVTTGCINWLSRKVHTNLDTWQTRPLSSYYCYIYLDVIKGEGFRSNTTLVVAIGRERRNDIRRILGVKHVVQTAGQKSWALFSLSLKDRGLQNSELIITDTLRSGWAKHVCPQAQWQWSVDTFYGDVLFHVPAPQRKEVHLLLQAIHQQKTQKEAQKKCDVVGKKLEMMHLYKAAKFLTTHINSTLTYYHFPRKDWETLKNNNAFK